MAWMKVFLVDIWSIFKIDKISTEYQAFVEKLSLKQFPAQI